jgi:hypothetical protein
MRVLKTKTFARWTRKEGVADAALRAAVEEMRAGLVDANLGADLVKKRIARPGRGKSGGWRTVLATNLRDRWVFLYGFAKNERDNVDDDELRGLKLLAQTYLGFDEDTITRLVEAGELKEARDGEQETA